MTQDVVNGVPRYPISLPLVDELLSRVEPRTPLDGLPESGRLQEWVPVLVGQIRLL